jgi:ParB family chromosome partitioning protein
MASLKDLAESRAALLNFDPRKIAVKPDLNARDTSSEENRAHIEALAESIARDGVRVPLVIFQEGENVFVADGHCRLAATMLAIARGADIKTVPCIPEARGTNDVDRVLSQNIYNSGKRLSALEEGVNFRKALALGATEQQIAEKVGRSITHVKQSIDMQAMPEAVKTLVREGKISASLAAKTVKKEGSERASAKLKAAVEANGEKRVLPKHVVPTSLSLKDGLRDMISGGRLTKEMIPDDFDWLCAQLGLETKQ